MTNEDKKSSATLQDEEKESAEDTQDNTINEGYLTTQEPDSADKKIIKQSRVKIAETVERRLPLQTEEEAKDEWIEYCEEKGMVKVLQNDLSVLMTADPETISDEERTLKAFTIAGRFLRSGLPLGQPVDREWFKSVIKDEKLIEGALSLSLISGLNNSMANFNSLFKEGSAEDYFDSDIARAWIAVGQERDDVESLVDAIAALWCAHHQGDSVGEKKWWKEAMADIAEVDERIAEVILGDQDLEAVCNLLLQMRPSWDRGNDFPDWMEKILDKVETQRKKEEILVEEILEDD